MKAQKENIALKKTIKQIFNPCYHPWMPEFSLITTALWEQYKPKHEYDEPPVFIWELKKPHRKFTMSPTDPGTKASRRKFTIDERKF